MRQRVILNVTRTYNLLLLIALPVIVSAFVPAEFQTLLSGYRSFSNLTNAATGNDETYGVNITTWQMPHGGFCMARRPRTSNSNTLHFQAAGGVIRFQGYIYRAYVILRNGTLPRHDMSIDTKPKTPFQPVPLPSRVPTEAQVNQ